MYILTIYLYLALLFINYKIDKLLVYNNIYN